MTRAPGALVCLSVAAFLGGQEPPRPPENLVPGPPRAGINAAAEDLAEAAFSLGIDFDAESPGVAHPAAEDVAALQQTGASGWLADQVMVPDDSIGPEPARLRQFLEDRSGALWRIVAILEKGVPEWPSASRAAGASSRFVATLRLSNVLLATALAEEGSGRTSDAARLLGASWTLYRSLSRERTMLADLIAIAVARLQAGALRKFREPPIEWSNRLSNEDPWQAALDAFASDPREAAAADPRLALDALSGSFANVNARAHVAGADALRRLPPCDLAGVSNEEIARPISDEFRKASQPGTDSAEVAQVFTDIVVPNFRNHLERAGRLAIDNELTLRILELRLARASARDRRWPDALPDDASSACPGASYAYERDGSAMQIAFKGEAPSPSTGLALPLSFATRADRRPTPHPAAPASAPMTPAPPRT